MKVEVGSATNIRLSSGRWFQLPTAGAADLGELGYTAAEQAEIAALHWVEPVETEVDATDAAREIAAEHGLDLSSVTGTGADGRIVVSDVRAAIDEDA